MRVLEVLEEGACGGEGVEPGNSLELLLPKRKREHALGRRRGDGPNALVVVDDELTDELESCVSLAPLLVPQSSGLTTLLVPELALNSNHCDPLPCLLQAPDQDGGLSFRSDASWLLLSSSSRKYRVPVRERGAGDEDERGRSRREEVERLDEGRRVRVLQGKG